MDTHIVGWSSIKRDSHAHCKDSNGIDDENPCLPSLPSLDHEMPRWSEVMHLWCVWPDQIGQRWLRYCRSRPKSTKPGSHEALPKMAAVINPAWSCSLAEIILADSARRLYLKQLVSLCCSFFFDQLQSLPAVSFFFSSCRLAMGALRTREFQLRRPPGFFQAHWSFFAG